MRPQHPWNNPAIDYVWQELSTGLYRTNLENLVNCNNCNGSTIVFMSSTISLSKAERVELSQRATSQAGRADDARRARLTLLLEAGET